jgi:hypothetical protein
MKKTPLSDTLPKGYRRTQQNVAYFREFWQGNFRCAVAKSTSKRRVRGKTAAK